MARGRKFTREDIFAETEKLLLKNGYEAFSISLVAESLKVSRSAIYKHYTNKEALILDFMVEEMRGFIDTLEGIKEHDGFRRQFRELVQIIFQSKDLHQVLGLAHMVPHHNDEGLMEKKQVLSQLHVAMYSPLLQLIELGKQEGIVTEEISSQLILSFLFQSIAIPNHLDMEAEAFIESIEKMICHGIFTNDK